MRTQISNRRRVANLVWSAIILVAFAAPACDRGNRDTQPTSKGSTPKFISSIKSIRVDTAPGDDRAKWIQQNAVALSGLDFVNTASAHLIADIDDRRIVLLGESIAPIGEFRRAKLSIVRLLHEQMGFNVLAFDGPLLDCAILGQRASEVSALQLLNGCAPWEWQSVETRELFEYVKSTQTTANPLELTGFAFRRSTLMPSTQPPPQLAEIVARADEPYAKQVHLLDSAYLSERRAWKRTGRVMFGQPSQLPLSIADDFDSLSAWLFTRATVSTLPEKERAYFRIGAAAARSNAFDIRSGRQAERSTNISSGEGLASNIGFLQDSLYPTQKLIVWSNNARVRRGSAATFLAGREPTMGALVAQRRRNDTFIIGLYASSGYAIRSKLGSLEDLFQSAVDRPSYLATHNFRGHGTQWLGTPLLVATEMGQWPMVSLSEEFDAIVVIPSVSAAKPVVVADSKTKSHR